ncbi:hypothetical protein [Nostoc sp.]|uniref:hypothetical protein n=1 Tax=Nostoc sp. TaxID=1180 RepID=UPI002FF63F5E
MNLFELLAGEDNHPALVTPGGRSLTYKQVHILDQLPRGATGKLQRLAMAKLLNIGQ